MLVDIPQGVTHYYANGNKMTAQSGNLHCSWETTNFNNGMLAIYNDQLNPRPGKNTYYTRLGVWDETLKRYIGWSDFLSFENTGSEKSVAASVGSAPKDRKAKKERKKIDFGELLGIIADGLEDISETLEESNKMLQSLDPNNYNTPQNTYNSSFESSNNNNNYANNDEERKKKDEEYKQRKEERDNKAKQMEWLGKHGSTYTNLYMKWYEIIQDVKRKTITVENWEPEYRLSQLKTAQSKCKEIAKLYKEKTGDEIPCPKNDLDWVPSAKDLVGSR